MSNPQVSIRKATTNDIAQIVVWLDGELHAHARDSVANEAILASLRDAKYWEAARPPGAGSRLHAQSLRCTPARTAAHVARQRRMAHALLQS